MAHSVFSVCVVDRIVGRVLLFELAGRKPGPISIFAFRPLARQQEINVVQRLGLQRPGQRFGFLVYQLRRAHGLKVSRPKPVVNLRTRYALRAAINSSSLSAMACTSACVGGLDTVRPSGKVAMSLARVSSKLFWMAWKWPRISPETSGELSAGKVGSRMGVAIRSLGFDLVWFPSPLFYARPRARTSREINCAGRRASRLTTVSHLPASLCPSWDESRSWPARSPLTLLYRAAKAGPSS